MKDIKTAKGFKTLFDRDVEIVMNNYPGISIVEARQIVGNIHAYECNQPTSLESF